MRQSQMTASQPIIAHGTSHGSEAEIPWHDGMASRTRLPGRHPGSEGRVEARMLRVSSAASVEPLRSADA